MLVSSYRVAANFITLKLPEHNTENEEFEKSRVLQKCPLTHITLIIIIILLLLLLLLIIITELRLVPKKDEYFKKILMN